ncbi:MAG: flavodoxin-dependent (E)-4-hydroxy-3-methylbut-2-enyl-diphosphate synthase, partial [Oscillospiraceae bacterium]|nr:flavodoxin-dependent (E)-4-hydroxy-3-methylbut-2-enyl-diphosphate synthase [Oscillospiraceae bacterium]
MNVHKVRVGGLELGSGKIYIQSMLNVPADDTEGNVRQAVTLERAGCEIVRVSVPDMRNVALIPAIK